MYLTMYDYLKDCNINELIEKFTSYQHYLGDMYASYDVIIERLSRPNYLSKYFSSDYYFWDMHYDFLKEKVPSGEELYKKREFDKIIEECKKLREKYFTPYDILQKVYNDELLNFEGILSFAKKFIEVPDKLKLKVIKREGKYDKVKINECVDIFNHINLNEFKKIFTKINDEDSKYILEVTEKFIESLKSIKSTELIEESCKNYYRRISVT